MGKIKKINLGWRFHLGDAPDAGYMAFDDRAWRTVTLPHDWAVEHPFDQSHASGTGYLPGGIAWYRNHFNLSSEEASRRIRLIFQGIYKHARVWINSNYLGQHAYGYTSFSFDISEFIREGENVIAVRAEHENVADSRWYTGSGITRPVLLEFTDPVCFAENGIFVTTAEVRQTTATLRIQYKTSGAAKTTFRLLDKNGSSVMDVSGDQPEGVLEATVLNPRCWSPDDPFLYQLECNAWNESEIRDTVLIPVGIRVFRFDPDRGFFLNDQPMKLRGVCVHHDAGCLGAAVPKSVWQRRLKKFRDAGCNAIRTAHNPPDPDLLDLCDEMGFLVMDEAFDEWEGIKNKWWQGHNVYPPKHFGYAEDFPQWHKADLESMILRDRNHPCIVIWSIGNEIDYPNDPYVTPLFKEVLGNNDANKPLAERLYDIRKPDAGRLAVVAEKLAAIVHSLDDSRPVTSALSFPELSNRTGFADALDIVGYNYREHFYEEDHQKYPQRVLLGSENSHDPKAWRAVRDHDYISAQFLWTGIDFLGECKGWPVRISQAGMLTLAGFEKPLQALRKALWTSEPMVRIAISPSETERPGPWSDHFRWEGRPGEIKKVSCYTNTDEAELFLNGKSLGKKTLREEDGCRLTWEVPYQDGFLQACVPGAEDILYTPGIARKIEMTADKSSMHADGEDICQIEIMLTDQNDQPAVDEIVYCQLLGDLKLLGMENGKADDLTPYSEAFRTTLEGKAIIYIRAGQHPGSAEIHVRSASGLESILPISLK